MEIIIMHEMQLNLCSVWNFYNFSFIYDKKTMYEKKDEESFLNFLIYFLVNIDTAISCTNRVSILHFDV